MNRLLAFLFATNLVWGQESLTLEWDAVDKARGYVVYQGVASSVSTNEIATPETSVTLSNLPPDIYNFSVAAYASPGWEGPRSDSITVEVEKDVLYFQFSPVNASMAFQLEADYTYKFQILSNGNWTTTQIIKTETDRRTIYIARTNNFRILRGK